MRDLAALTAPYATILCDIWGVIHDGAALLPGAAQRLAAWKAEGKAVILLTNAPRPAETVQAGLDRVGLPRSSYDAITSSGAAGIAALTDPPRPVGFLGTRADRADLIAHGVLLAEEEFAEVACTGLDEWRDDPKAYRAQLSGWADGGIVLHCLNPDRVVIHRGRREACAGALADLYEAMGGTVRWYGKPHRPIYEHALALADRDPAERVLAIGDGLATDMLGAATMGFDAIFVSHGIHGGAPFPDDFAARHGLGPWQPIAVVADLG